MTTSINSQANIQANTNVVDNNTTASPQAETFDTAMILCHGNVTGALSAIQGLLNNSAMQQSLRASTGLVNKTKDSLANYQSGLDAASNTQSGTTKQAIGSIIGAFASAGGALIGGDLGTLTSGAVSGAATGITNYLAGGDNSAAAIYNNKITLLSSAADAAQQSNEYFTNSSANLYQTAASFTTTNADILGRLAGIANW